MEKKNKKERGKRKDRTGRDDMARVQSDVGVSAEDERMSQCSNCLGSDEKAAKYGDTDHTGDNYYGVWFWSGSGKAGGSHYERDYGARLLWEGSREKTTTTIGADRGAADPSQSIFGPLPTEIGLKEAADPRLALSDNQ